MRYLAIVVTLTLLFIPLSHAYSDNNEIAYNWSFYGQNFEVVININGSENSSLYHSFNFWVLNLTVPYDAYQFYRDYPAGYRIGDNLSYLSYFLTPNDTYIRELAHMLDTIAKKNGWDRLTEANFILTFVQHVPYVSDFASTGFVDYYKFPLETLFQKGGDCEDKSLLLATLLYILGYDVVLFAMEVQFQGLYGHVAVGIDVKNKTGPFARYLQYYYAYDGKDYYYMESTGSQSMVISGGGIENVHYWVGISPEAAGAKIYNLTVIPLNGPHYEGYHQKYDYVKEVNAQESFNWYLLYALALLVLFLPLFVYAISKEKKRCPSCGYSLEDDFNYCPNCGYWLNPPWPPKPPFS